MKTRLEPLTAITIMIAIAVVLSAISLAIISIQNNDLRMLVQQVNDTATDIHIIADRLANTQVGVLINRTHFLEVLENHTTDEILQRLDHIDQALNISSTTN